MTGFQISGCDSKVPFETLLLFYASASLITCNILCLFKLWDLKFSQIFYLIILVWGQYPFSRMLTSYLFLWYKLTKTRPFGIRIFVKFQTPSSIFVMDSTLFNPIELLWLLKSYFLALTTCLGTEWISNMYPLASGLKKNRAL